MHDSEPVASFTLLDSDPLTIGLLDLADRVLAGTDTPDGAISRHYVTYPSRSVTALVEALRAPGLCVSRAGRVGDLHRVR
jgi:hypothetical protein